MKHKVVTNKTAKFLSHFHRRKKTFFTFQQAQQELKTASQPYVSNFLNELIERELLMRLKNGLYHLIPYETPANEYFPDWNLIAPHLVRGNNYYIGYNSALVIHDINSQPFLGEQVVVDKQIRPSIEKIHDIKFRFIYHNPSHFFGVKKTWVIDHDWVYCSDVEKTIIDCLFQPHYAGGIVEVSNAIYYADYQKKLDYKKLLTHAIQFNNQSVIKRLGFLLELHQIGSSIIDDLQNCKTNTIATLTPVHLKEGKIDSRWSIKLNFNVKTLLESPFS